MNKKKLKRVLKQVEADMKKRKQNLAGKPLREDTAFLKMLSRDVDTIIRSGKRPTISMRNLKKAMNKSLPPSVDPNQISDKEIREVIFVILTKNFNSNSADANDILKNIFGL